MPISRRLIPPALLVGATLFLAQPAAAHLTDGVLGVVHSHPHGAAPANPIGLAIAAGLLLLGALASGLLARRPGAR